MEGQHHVMMKSICTLSRRADFSREAFQHYYENTHAPLAIKHFPFTRYVRNHVVDQPDIGFDTISEFWADDVARLMELMTGPVGDILREDERRFMDQSKIAPGVSEEHVLASGLVANERYAVLLNWDDESFDLSQWAKALAASQPNCSIDVVSSWQQPAFPARAVLWTLDNHRPSSLPSSVTSKFVKVRRVETDPEMLLASRGASSL